MVGLTSPDLIQHKSVPVSFEPQVANGKTMYKGQEVNVPASREIGRVFSDFLNGDEVKSHLESNYRAKAIPAGSLAAGTSVREGTTYDFDARVIDIQTNKDVPLEVLKQLSRDEKFYELCLDFLDTGDTPKGILGRALSQFGVTLQSKNIDFVAPVIADESVKGFQTATWTYHKQFGKVWKTDPIDYNDPMVLMRRRIRQQIEKEKGLI